MSARDYRAEMLAIIAGETPARPLFVPRLDIWYNRNRARGTLPPKFADRTLPEIAAALGVGVHAVIPDFIRGVPVAAVHHRGLGFYNHPDFPYVADFSAVDYEVAQTANELRVTYHGPRGEITTACNYGADLLASGSSIPDITEPAVKSPADYARLAAILDRVRIRPQTAGYDAWHDRLGAAGLAVAYLAAAAGPMQHIMRDLRKFEPFCMDLHDAPDAVAACAEALAPLYDAILASAADTAAEVALFGANYDDTITWRPFFAAHIAPWLDRAADRLHTAGKYLLTHTDGENRGLLPVLRDRRLDVADSVCPAPMTRVSFRDYRDFFGKRTTIWGGIPSNLMLPACCTEPDFRAYVRQLLADARPYDRLILAIADTTPPDADFSRLRYLVDACVS